MADKRNKGRELQDASVEKDWLSELAETLAIKPAPPGWYTISQIAEKLNIGRTAVRTILKDRSATAKKFYQVTSDGRTVSLLHYKL